LHSTATEIIFNATEQKKSPS